MLSRVFKNIFLSGFAALFVFGVAFAAANESVSYTITASGSRNEDTQSGYWETITSGYWEEQQSGHWEVAGATGVVCEVNREAVEGDLFWSCHEENFSDCTSYWDQQGPGQRAFGDYGCQENRVWRDTSTREWRETSTQVWRDTSTTEKKSWSASESGSFTIACETNKYITTSALRSPNGNTSWGVTDNNQSVTTSMSGPNLYATNVSAQCGGSSVPSGASQQQQGQPTSSSGAAQGQQEGVLPSAPSAPSEPPSPVIPPAEPPAPQTPEFQEI